MGQGSVKPLEQILREELSGQIKQSPSHDLWHLHRVREFALQLQEIYGGDADVLTIALLLHDLGRADPSLHGKESRRRSVEAARRLLERVSGRIDLDLETWNKILSAIDEHDQPEKEPSSLEGRILKDADFLAGFGAWGILRTALWAAESQEGIPGFVRRLKEGMPRRASHLSFPASRRYALREMRLARLFLAELEKPSFFSNRPDKGEYFVFEGISGSGKSTIAERVFQHLTQQGRKVILVFEPPPNFREVLSGAGEAGGDPVVRMFLLMAVRYQQVKDHIHPALSRDEVVLSARGYLSTMVYQENSFFSREAIEYFHNFMPADFRFILDCDPQIAWERIGLRAEREGKPLSPWENLQRLAEYRRRYLEIAASEGPGEIIVVDASGSIEETTEEVLGLISMVLKEGEKK